MIIIDLAKKLRRKLLQLFKWIKRLNRGSIFELITLNREQMIKHCKKKEAIHFIGEEYSFEIKKPFAGDIPSEFVNLYGTQLCSLDFVCELSNAHTIGPYGIPQSRSGYFLMEPMGKIGMFRSRMQKSINSLGFLGILKQVVKNITKEKNNTSHVMVGHIVARHGHHWDNPNYGHWLTENLPQLQLLENYREKTGQDFKLLINVNSPQWVIETLEIMGYSKESLIETTCMQNSFSFEKLILPKLNYIHSMGMQFNPKGRKWVAERMKSYVLDNSDPNEQKKFLYVSRQGTYRKVINYNEVMSLLLPLGFEIVRPDLLTVQEQVKLFSAAKLIVGPFGAGLCNMIFAEDASVIEIAARGEKGTIFFGLAKELGFEYARIEGEMHGFLKPNYKKRNQDILVDVNKLEQFVDEAIRLSENKSSSEVNH